ncbi:MAG: YkgJ family cysteine cluster protein [Kofleriaceae bacterium]|nr:YkgJ family cysteine cluster protein [Kofleriaceae bacterium]
MSSRAIRATHYRLLTEKLDGFFARVVGREAAAMQCETGCSDCCQYGLSATLAEAEAVAMVVAAMTDEERSALAHNIDCRQADVATGAADTRCVALSQGGRCMIYAGRPTVCRSHGVPVRMRNERSLPVVSACYRNFVDRAPDTIAADCVLDQTTLSATLLAINAGASERFALDELLLDLLEQA